MPAKRLVVAPSAASTPEERVAAIKQRILDKLFCTQGKFPRVAAPYDYYQALSYTVRDRLLYHWIHSAQTYFENNSRTVVCLSAEYLPGPHLANNLLNLGMHDDVVTAVRELGHSLDDWLAVEEEPGLGNGGLGRLAACFMDSLATLEIPAIGYGIRYEFGIFDQEIRDGWQVEVTDKWLRMGNPWEIAHPAIRFDIKMGGHTEPYRDPEGRYRVRWIPDHVIKGTPYDTVIPGYRVNSANLLRLWKAEASESFDFHAFNAGDYYRAVEDKMTSENLTKVLYPNDEPMAGKQLRLQQQYFFVSCALQDMIRIYLQKETTLAKFHEKYAVQLNDTHPAIGVAELMRLLVDEYGMEWDEAWHITSNTFAYTNHTLLPEALEAWSLPLFAKILPRHLEIIYEINTRFLADVRKRFPGDDGLVARLSLIEESGGKRVRMAHLACVGSLAINGVAALHSRLLGQTILKDFHTLWPDKFSNKTNGVTPRRFMALANPGLTRLLSGAIGDGWIRDLDQLRALEPFAEDGAFCEAWRAVKLDNKRRLGAIVQKRCGLMIDPVSLFDCQVKRIHEYKRQHLNVLHILTLYLRGINGRLPDAVPRTFVFGGKAAPGYVMAKLIIKLIHAVGGVIARDARTRDLLRVVFVPDFNVTVGQIIYPAADLSEQISTAGMEASGTGNMKFSLNGALTIGTLDGANVEIRESVGADNFFLFGLTAREVARRKQEGYHPRALYDANPELREVVDFIGSGALSGGDRNLFQPLVQQLIEEDRYLLMADYASYIQRQDQVGQTYRDPQAWTRMSILNVARMGGFSSDRAIREYCRDIWRVNPVRVTLPPSEESGACGK